MQGSAGSSTLITKMKIEEADPAPHLEWLARLMMAGVESSGALSSEIFPPSFFGSKEWVLMQRFASQEALQEWRGSRSHDLLFQQLQKELENQSVTLSETIDMTQGSSSISVAIVTHVKEGQEKAYFAQEAKYQAAQAAALGFHGAYVQPPTSKTPGTWITILRFASSEALDRWFASSKRKQLVKESAGAVKSTDFHNVTTSFPGWFSSKEAGAKGPPNWKTAMLILLGLYPSVMLVIYYLLPLMQGYPAALNNFIGNILTVAFTTWVSMPFFISVYKAWLFPDRATPKWVPAISLSSILLFYIAEVAFFWRFF